MIVDIKDISSNVLLVTTPNEGCKRKFTLQKEDYILLKFSLENPIYFKLGSYVECDLGLFEVCDLQSPTFNTDNAGYDYELRLDAHYWKWKNKIFKYAPETAGQEASWNLTASLDVHVGIVLRNLKALGYKYKGRDFEFSIDSSVENKSQLMSYDNINILDACFEMAKKWDCECWVTENIIHFGKCEFGDPVDFEIGVNVQEMTRSDSQSTYATRIYAFGSTRNIPSNYRPVDESIVVNGVVQKRLMLPVDTPCIDAYPDMNIEEAVEQVVVFDEIFPRRTGTMSDITTKEYTEKIENADGTTTEEKWNAYRFKDTGITFSKDYILPGEELKITFQSGKLNGMVFAVAFDPDGKDEQLWEIVRNEDYGRKLPGDVLVPEDGGKYVLSGWDSTKITELGLVDAAEQELKAETEKYVAKSKIDPNTYNCTMMSDNAYSEDGMHNLYGIGQRVNLINKAYFENGRLSRVIGFEFNLDKPYDSPVYTVGETAAYSRIGELEDKVENLTLKGQVYTGGSGSGVYVIRRNDSTPATDSNVFSALRVMAEINENNDNLEKLFLSRLTDDEAAGHLTVHGGLTGKASITGQAASGTLSSGIEEIADDDDYEGDGIVETATADVGTLGNLDNVDDAVDNPTENAVILYKDALSSTWVQRALAMLGLKGDKGDGISFKVLGSYNTLAELQAAHPDGSDLEGFFKVGSLIYIWTGSGYEPIDLDVFSGFVSELFTDISFSGDTITIDHSKTPYSKVTLNGTSVIFNLVVSNTVDGSTGRILVFQTGFKQIAVADNIKGTVDLPLSAGTIALLSYNKVGSVIYMRSDTILGDVQYPVPQKVTDFQVVYSDANSCVIQWTAPYANNIYDKATQYDMRYANSLVDANDSTIWAGLKKVSGVPTPTTPGELQTMSISGLSPNKEYYIYIKSIKNNYGISYSSTASTPVYFKTSGSEDTSKAYRITLSGKNILLQHSTPLTDSNGDKCTPDRMVDEQELNVFLDTGYPDTSFKGYVTYWYNYPYGRNASPYDVYFDLFSMISIDRIYVYSRSKPRFSVYGMRDFGYSWTKIGEIQISYNSWSYISAQSEKYRFIKFSFDLNDFGRLSLAEGSAGMPSDEWNDTIDRIDNIIIYGRPASSVPDGIRPPIRKSTTRKTVDEFFCVNGHAYQQGRLHSKCSGSHVRLYISPGHFASWEGNGLVDWQRIADMRFSVDDIGWIKNNNGSGDGFVAHLQNTYAKYGLRPYLTFTSVFDYCLYDKTGSNKHNRGLDCYWLPGAWRAVPRRGVGGTADYFAVTYDPASYKTMGKLAYSLAAKYGKQPISGSSLFWPADADSTTGLDLISGVEIENEPDADWNNWIGYTRPEEYAAITSAAADGNGGAMTDEDGNKPFGIKGADSNQLAIGSGTAGVNPGYYESAILHYKSVRALADIPVDVFSMHRYFSITGNQHSGSTETVQYAVTAEYAVENMLTYVKEMIEVRNRLAPDKEIWLTEFGYGEAGARDSNSGFQCYSQAGKAVGDWIIPDRHRGDVKGAWIVRASLYLMSLGIDMVNYYSTECEGNYFGTGKWDSGAGFEMFHWKDEASTAPGAKYAAIEKYEVSYARGSFSCMGLFGNILSNGAYPISRAYWWVATMRNRLKGYVYTGRKYMDDDKIMIYCFKKVGEDKGAYVTYYNDRQNTGVAGVEIPVPDGVASVEHVTIYVPELPNPENVPNTIGYDRNRTGLACARHERYIDGQWIVKSAGAYAQGAASYPSNPQEGDEIVMLPTTVENPYFPIVGAVNAKASSAGNNLTAQQYEYTVEGSSVPVTAYDVSLAWRQVEAVCDYIDYTAEGQKGSVGKSVTEDIIREVIVANISEFPEIYLFDGIPDPDYRSEVADLASSIISSSAVELWWNNTNTEDTSYEIFVSGLPETGYTLLKEVSAGLENMTSIAGLLPDTTYYYKVRPKRGNKVGMLSDYVSAKTYSELPAPTNLRLSSRTATSISIAWDYTTEQVADFVHYAVYRADEGDSYSLVANVTDKSVTFYSDSSLQVGAIYKYKVRSVGLNGQSSYTDILETRTLLPEECPPQLLSAMTDKLGTKIILTFDLALSEAVSKDGFSLTEDGNVRLITSAARNNANTKQLFLYIPSGTLAEYDGNTSVRISYDTSVGSILSQYNVALDSFSSIKVDNVIGNYTNIEATFKLNLCGATSTLPTDAEWNSFAGSPNSDISMQLVDTYGRASDIIAATVNNGSTLKWGGVITSGYCEIEDIESAVYSVGWTAAYRSTYEENILARLRLSGLNNEHKYAIKAYGGFKSGTSRSGKLKINGQYSSIVEQIGNVNTYMTIEDCVPSFGVLDIDFVNMSTNASSTAYPAIHFIIIEEYKSNDEPENMDVYIREVTIAEDSDGEGITAPDIHLNLNLIGTATAWRAAETEEELEGFLWTDIVENSLSVPYAITTGYGDKTLYVQAKNLYAESNVKSVTVSYKNPEIALNLSSIILNNDDADTYDRNITAFLSKSGTPTHYRISENSSFLGTDWQEWVSESVAFTLSEGSALKTVYAQIKNDTTESVIKADTIELKSLTILSLDSIYINNGASETTNKAVSVALAYSNGTPTHYRLSESSDSMGDWIAFASSPVSYDLSDGGGLKTLYCQIKDDATESLVLSSSITYTTPVQTNAKVLISLGWSNGSDGYDIAYGINKVWLSNGVSKTLKNINGVDAAILVSTSATAGVGQHKQGAVTGTDSGTYPDIYLEKNAFVMKYGGVASMYFKISGLATGSYKIRLFNSTVSNNGKVMPQALYEIITSGFGTGAEISQEITQPSGYTYINNISQWIEGPVSVNGDLYIRVTTKNFPATVVSPLNIIELIPQ